MKILLENSLMTSEIKEQIKYNKKNIIYLDENDNDNDDDS
jgi:hypothetical protein